MVDCQKAIAVQDDLIARRKGALARKKTQAAEKAGVVGERELKKLLRQAQRRKAKLVKDRDRRASGKKAS